MSDGRVFHVCCPGEFIYHLSEHFTCNYCDAKWDGKAAGIAEYRQLIPADIQRKVAP